MIQVSIKKQEQITNQASFQSIEEAQAWCDYHIKIGSFGESEKSIIEIIDIPEVRGEAKELITPAELDADGNELTPAIYKIVQNGIISLARKKEKIVLKPAEYEIIIEDITAKLEQQKINQEAQAFLSATDWMIIRELDSGVPCPENIKLQRQEARSKIVK